MTHSCVCAIQCPSPSSCVIRFRHLFLPRWHSMLRSPSDPSRSWDPSLRTRSRSPLRTLCSMGRLSRFRSRALRWTRSVLHGTRLNTRLTRHRTHLHGRRDRLKSHGTRLTSHSSPQDSLQNLTAWPTLPHDELHCYCNRCALLLIAATLGATFERLMSNGPRTACMHRGAVLWPTGQSQGIVPYSCRAGGTSLRARTNDWCRGARGNWRRRDLRERRKACAHRRAGEAVRVRGACRRRYPCRAMWHVNMSALRW